MKKMSNADYKTLERIIRCSDEGKSIEEVVQYSSIPDEKIFKKLKKRYFNNDTSAFIEFIKNNLIEERYVEVSFTASDRITRIRKIDENFDEEKIFEFIKQRINLDEQCFSDNFFVHEIDNLQYHYCMREMCKYEDAIH